MRIALTHLRRHAIASTLFTPTTLGRAINKLGFLQADPIRAPARAQDLILRHRVKDYQAGNLDRSYHALRLEEDYLFAYGFMPRTTWNLLHPRQQRELTPAERQVLEIVSTHKRLHPRRLEAYLGRSREVNAWGGYSKSTTRSLERLHYLGLLRIAGRENGNRLYQPTTLAQPSLSPDERLRRLVLLIANILAPLSETSLRATLRHLGRAAPDLEGRRGAVTTLLRNGDLESADVDGIRYVWPTGRLLPTPPGDVVRILAPFDPLVWDRRRFEHFWGWPYRFEAYTPPAKRKLGYYAMPLLWREEIIGWVNISVSTGKLVFEPGFTKLLTGSQNAFHKAFRAETERFREFLVPPKSATLK